RNAKIARRSSSFSWAKFCHGIGGRIGRPSPWCLPVFSALTNMSAVQLPSPVVLSGVRFAVKLVPHGPDHAVKSLEPTAPQAVGAIRPAGTLGSLSAAGWPDSRRDISGSGPVSLKTFGL